MRTSFACVLLATASCVELHDWPMFGRDATRNAVSPEKDPPTDWSLARGKERNVLWRASLGQGAQAPPVVADGLVWIGTGSNPGGSSGRMAGGVLLCFRERDGMLLWRREFPNRPELPPEATAMTSTLRSCPLVEGDRLLLLNNRWEVLCLDIAPLKKGTGEPRELWRTDLVATTGTYPDIWGMGLCQTCSIGASYRGMIYVSTANGLSMKDQKPVRPEAPALVCLDAATGELLGREASGIGARTVIGSRSSPLAVEVDGKGFVIFGGGDGYLYAFDPVPVEQSDRPGSRILKELWRVDCNPEGVRAGQEKPFGIVGTPVIHEGRAYALLGADFEDSTSAQGNLCCVDVATGRKLWSTAGVGLSPTTPVVHDGLVYVADVPGFIHALDARTGREVWQHDALSTIAASPLLADGRLFVTTMDSEVLIFDVRSEGDSAGGLSKRLRFIRPLPDSVYAGPILAHGTLYLATGRELIAIRSAAHQGSETDTTPVKRGRAPDALFVPTPRDVVWRMLQLARLGQGDVLYDLGSGDGRIVISAAKDHQCRSVGVEIDRELVERSREAIRQAKVEGKATIEHEDLLKVDFSAATVVTLYVGERLNRLLLPKLQMLKPGSRIICHQFPIPGVKADQVLQVESEEDGRDHPLYFYQTPLAP